MDEKLLALKDQIVAVSKGHSIEQIHTLYNLGFRIFGENKAQELLTKVPYTLDNMSWHFIGHLQTNKVKQILPYVDLIHSVDSYHLLETINKEAKKINKIQKVLLQVNIAKEETKHGFSEEEIIPFIKNIKDLNNISINGMMVMGPHVEDEKMIHEVFKKGDDLFNQIKDISDSNWTILSMGMSDDYQIALEHHSTLLRLGTILFKDL